jgi:hypothetical protein
LGSRVDAQRLLFRLVSHRRAIYLQFTL